MRDVLGKPNCVCGLPMQGVNIGNLPSTNSTPKSELVLELQMTYFILWRFTLAAMRPKIDWLCELTLFLEQPKTEGL